MDLKFFSEFYFMKTFSWIIYISSELYFGFQKFKMKTYVNQIHLFKTID